MKREDVKAMKPGRELDALVAEHIFQWRRISGPKTDYDGPCEYGDVLVPPTIISEDEAYRMMPPKGAIPIYYFVNRKWSTDISAAWEVFEKFDTPFVKKNFDVNDEDYFLCKIGGDIVFGKTAPEAICKASLLAVLEDINLPGEETE